MPKTEYKVIRKTVNWAVQISRPVNNSTDFFSLSFIYGFKTKASAEKYIRNRDNAVV